jgi:hypothetical protein
MSRTDTIENTAEKTITYTIAPYLGVTLLQGKSAKIEQLLMREGMATAATGSLLIQSANLSIVLAANIGIVFLSALYVFQILRREYKFAFVLRRGDTVQNKIRFAAVGLLAARAVLSWALVIFIWERFTG